MDSIGSEFRLMYKTITFSCQCFKGISISNYCGAICSGQSQMSLAWLAKRLKLSKKKEK